MAAPYVSGVKLRLSVAFTDNNNNPIDPTTLTLRHEISGGAEATETYNPGSIVRDGVGLYHYDLDTTGATTGIGTYEWVSTGTGQAATLNYFNTVALPI